MLHRLANFLPLPLRDGHSLFHFPVLGKTEVYCTSQLSSLVLSTTSAVVFVDRKETNKETESQKTDVFSPGPHAKYMVPKQVEPLTAS